MEENSKFRSVLTCLWITGAFWAILLLAPAVIALVNRWDSFIYQLGRGSIAISLLAQPIACAFASEVAESISDGQHDVCVFVNQIIAIFVSVILALYAFFIRENILDGIVCIISAAVVIFSAVGIAKNFGHK